MGGKAKAELLTPKGERLLNQDAAGTWTPPEPHIIQAKIGPLRITIRGTHPWTTSRSPKTSTPSCKPTE